MAANLSLVMDDTDKVRALHDDALANGLAILPPDVNASNYRFEPIDAKRIRYGLGGIKGTGAQAIEAIVAARDAGGPFRDLFDFCRRVDKRLVNRRAVEALIRGGAFDAIDPRRADAVRVGRRRALRGREGRGLGGAGVAVRRWPREAADSSLVATREWTDAERLAHEKAALGFYLSGHPYAAFAEELAPLVRQPLSDLQPQKEPVLVAGIVTAMRTQTSRRGKMAFVTLDDGAGSAEIVVFNETFDAARSLLREDQLVVVEARIMQRNGDDGQAQGLRVVADAVLRPRRRSASATRRRCASRATAAPTPRGSPSCSRRFATAAARSSSSTGTTASAASSSCPTAGASTSTTRCSRGSGTGSPRRT